MKDHQEAMKKIIEEKKQRGTNDAHLRPHKSVGNKNGGMHSDKQGRPLAK